LISVFVRFIVLPPPSPTAPATTMEGAMPKHELVLDSGDYAPVADRITLFYARHPTGRILTRLVSRTEREITVQAFVFRSTEEERPAATGLASERIGDGDINTVACLENTETSAIGRALANLGLTASPNRPSREEMDKANRERARYVAEPARPPAASTPARQPSLTSHLTRPLPTSAALQRRADRVMDALDLLGQAERVGLPPRRARHLRLMLTQATASIAMIERIERLLRSWTTARHARHLRL
jgi:hypothetical protein